MKKIMMIGLLWVVFLWGAYNATAWIVAQPVELPTVSVQTMNEAQRAFYDDLLAERQAQAPRRLTIEETDETLYLYPDGSISWRPPEWFQDGEVVLLENDWDKIAELASVDTPIWVFWSDQMTVSEHNRLASGLLFGLLVGLFAGLFVGLFFGLLVGLFVWAVYGLVAGLVYGLVAGLVYGLVYISKSSWRSVATKVSLA